MSSSGPYWIGIASRMYRPPGRVDGQPNDYRERMAMFGIHDTSAVQATQAPVSKGVEAKDKNDEAAVEEGGEKKVENKDNGTADIKEEGEKKVEEEKKVKEEEKVEEEKKVEEAKKVEEGGGKEDK